MDSLKINGYTIIASARVWQEWEVIQDKDGVRPLYLRNQQDEILDGQIEEWTFEGGEYYIDDYTFKTFEGVEAYVKELPEVKD